VHAFRKVKVDWRKKALAFRAFDALPGGQHLYYLTQRYVTRTIPRNLGTHGKWLFEHARVFRQHYGDDLSKARLFEFGAGLDLFSNFVQWCYGVNDQVVVDIRRWVRVELVNQVIAYLKENPPPGGLRVPEIALQHPLEARLRRLYGIQYTAPADARRTGLEDGSIDLMCTTSVLEHVPVGALTEIFREAHRICHTKSVNSHVVDYTDHYAHSDATIGIYNFLRFTDDEWQRFNPAIHYQNRLRHADYGELFRAQGFCVRFEKAIAPDDSESLLSGVPLAGRFRDMPPTALLPRTGHWVLGDDR
jgi:hypothetical protein